jgi:hypothetical protein
MRNLGIRPDTSSRPRAAPVLVLVRRARRLLPLHPELRGRLAAGGASASAGLLIGPRSSRDTLRPERGRGGAGSTSRSHSDGQQRAERRPGRHCDVSGQGRARPGSPLEQHDPEDQALGPNGSLRTCLRTHAAGQQRSVVCVFQFASKRPFAGTEPARKYRAQSRNALTREGIQVIRLGSTCPNGYPAGGAAISAGPHSCEPTPNRSVPVTSSRR